MSPEDATLWLAVGGYLAFGLACLIALRARSGGGKHGHYVPPRRLRGVRAIVAAALDDVTPPSLPPGSAGAGRELDLGEIPPLVVTGPPGARGVAPADGLPVVRVTDCSFCRDDGFVGGCGACGRQPAMVRHARVNGSAVRR